MKDALWIDQRVVALRPANLRRWIPGLEVVPEPVGQGVHHGSVTRWQPAQSGRLIASPGMSPPPIGLVYVPIWTSALG